MTHPWELAWRGDFPPRMLPPLPVVVEYAEDLVKTGARRVLDLGCGPGRHSLYMASKGFEVIGLDVSDTALSFLASQTVKASTNKVVLVKHEMSSLPFIDSYFDAVLSTNVIHHGTLLEIEKTIGEVFRVLKSKGSALMTTVSTGDYKFGNGRRLEENTFVCTEGDERGITHHFFTRNELESCLKAFEITLLEEELIPIENGNRAHFTVKVQKP